MKALYAGTFDPITFGHLWILETASALFDEVIIAVALNPTKRCMFTYTQRIEMIHHSIAHLGNITVTQSQNEYLVNIAKTYGANSTIRGLRNQNDYLYEHAMRNINADMDPSVTTIFLIPPRELSEISSSMVKNLIGFTGWESAVRRYVPEVVLQQLTEAYHEKQ